HFRNCASFRSKRFDGKASLPIRCFAHRWISSRHFLGDGRTLPAFALLCNVPSLLYDAYRFESYRAVLGRTGSDSVLCRFVSSGRLPPGKFGHSFPDVSAHHWIALKEQVEVMLNAGIEISAIIHGRVGFDLNEDAGRTKQNVTEHFPRPVQLFHYNGSHLVRKHISDLPPICWQLFKI